MPKKKKMLTILKRYTKMASINYFKFNWKRLPIIFEVEISNRNTFNFMFTVVLDK